VTLRAKYFAPQISLNLGPEAATYILEKVSIYRRPPCPIGAIPWSIDRNRKVRLMSQAGPSAA
jgi:hypothetical protein